MKIEKVMNEMYIINTNTELNDIEKYKRIKRLISKFGKHNFLTGKKFGEKYGKEFIDKPNLKIQAPPNIIQHERF
jgi:hypothetical protein